MVHLWHPVRFTHVVEAAQLMRHIGKHHCSRCPHQELSI